MRNEMLVIYAIIITILFVLVIFAFGLVCIKEKYIQRIMVRLGLSDKMPTNWAVMGWNNTMEKLDYDADIVFFGDSLTRGSDFRAYFPDKKIVTLGYSGDSLLGMQERVSGVVAVNPKQVFVLGGINGLKSHTFQRSLDQYSKLLSMIREQMPNTQIIVQSVLPICKSRESDYCKNDVIVSFNEKLKTLAQKYDCAYVDIHSKYLNQNGEMDKTLTKDGIHLYSEAYDRWAETIRTYIN